jgi:AraC-like DNA-binding protein
MLDTVFLENLHYVPTAGWARCAFTVIRAGKVATAADYRVARMSHPGQDILFCLAGAGEVETDGHRFELRPGQLAWIANERPHAHAADRRNPWTLLWLRLDGPAPAELRRQMFGEDPPRVTFAEGAGPIPWFDRLFSAMRGGDHGLDLQLNLLVAELMLLIGRCRAGPAGEGLPAPLAALVAAMRANLRAGWSAAEISGVTGLGESQTRRLFRRYLRNSPRQWLLRERITHAQSLLVQTRAPLAEIAELCGFCDVYHLGREFRRAIGIAPATWRRSEIGLEPRVRRETGD